MSEISDVVIEKPYLVSHASTMEAGQTSRVCSKCGTALPPDAPQGLCPACLLERACREKPIEPGGGDSPQETPALPDSDTALEEVGVLIGRYKLLERIGEGGFGVVYMAEQVEPVQRRVALKVIKAGMDTKEVIARFEAERQALALMDHANIAKVFDAGTTGSAGSEISNLKSQINIGRPYFVMELVRGIPITRFCDQRQLTTTERLQLFIQLCKAVQHAHQKGIIHRDLKPSNILVTHQESEPMPKIIDFGVAKALGQKLTDKTLFTGFLRMVGTPAYMSPEQAEFTGIDIDTRSDLYSLGVLLYELLTGVTPFDAETLRNAALDEVRKMIRESEPPKPSTRLETLGEKLNTAAHRRRTEATKLVHRVRGDLDWIVMKCLEKDRRRRYETANGLAADVQRHLDNEPVVARPPSKLYEFQKTVRRHKFGFAAAAALIMVLSAGVLVSTLQAIRATRAERAQTRLREEADAANEQEKQAHLQTEQQALATRRLLYATDMHQADQAVKTGDLRRAVELLDRHRPKPGETDLRGWEWRLLWLLSRGDEEFTLCTLSNYVQDLKLSPDGHLLACASHEPIVHIWDPDARRSVTNLSQEAPVHGLAFSPDGQLLSVSGDQGIEIWDVAKFERIKEFPDPRAVEAIAFSPDGLRLAGGCNDGGVFILDRNGWRPSWRLQSAGLKNSILPNSESFIWPRLAFSPNSQWLAAAGGHGDLLLIDPLSGKVVQKIPGQGSDVLALAFSPDNQTLATGHMDGSLRIHSVSPGEALWSRTGSTTPTRALAFSLDGRLLASAGDQSIRLWNAGTGEALARLQTSSDVTTISFSAKGDQLLSGSIDGAIKVWSADNRPERYTGQSMGDEIAWFQFQDDGRTVSVWDQLPEELRNAMRLSFPQVAPLAFSPDFACVAFRTYAGSPLFKISLTGDDQLLTFDDATELHMHSISFSPDGRTLAASCNEGVWRWDALNGHRLPTLRGIGHFRARTSTFSHDGRRLAVGGETGERCAIQLWDLETDQEILTLEVPEAGSASTTVEWVEFSPDDLALGVHLSDGRGHLWRPPSWEEISPAEANRSMTTRADAETVCRVSVLKGEGSPRELEARLRKEQESIWKLHATRHRDLATPLSQLGGFFLDLGRFDRAEELEHKAISLMQGSSEEYDLARAWVLHTLASALKAQGKLDEALDAYHRSLGLLRERLGENDPNVAECICRIAWILKMQGDLAGAAEYYRKALDIDRTTLEEQDERIRGTLCLLGRVMEAKGDLSGAVDCYREARAIYRRAAGPPDITAVNAVLYLAGCLEKQGRGREDEGREEEKCCREALALAADVPNYPQSLVALIKHRLAHAQEAQGNLAGGEQSLREALEAYRKLPGKENPDAAVVRSCLVSVLDLQGKLDQAIAECEEIARLEPTNGNAHVNLAWYLATAADPKLRDGQRAVVHGKRAVELDPSQNNWDNLGVAHYRAGSWEESVECLERAQSMSRSPDYFHRFFLAMAHWQLGHKAKARQYYDEAITWMEQSGGSNRDDAEAEELRRFRAEAEELMGLASVDREEVLKQAFSNEIEQAPTNAAPWLGLARIYTRRESWDQAATDWAEAIELTEDTRRAGSPRRNVCRELAGWPEAFNRVAELRPQETTLWIGRAGYRVLRSQWTGAADDYAKAVLSRPVSSETFEYAALLLVLDDQEAYQRYCGELARRPDEPKDYYSAFILARTFGIGPSKGISPERLVELAAQASEQDAAWGPHVLGLAYYRAGKFDLAIKQLEESNAGKWNELAKAQNALVLAMAHHHQGNKDEAQKWLRQAQEKIAAAEPKNPDEPVDVAVPDWIELQVLRREAKALLN